MRPKWLLHDDDFEQWMMESGHEIGLFNEEHSNEWFLVARFPELEYTDCPKCKKTQMNYAIEDRYRFKCKSCGRKFSATSCTYLDATNLKPYYWMRLIYLIVELKFPINSVLLSYDLKLTQKTVYGMLTTIKRASKINAEGIKYKIERHETFWGLLEKLLTLNN